MASMAMIHDSVSETRQQLEYYFPPPGFRSVEQLIMNKAWQSDIHAYLLFERIRNEPNDKPT